MPSGEDPGLYWLAPHGPAVKQGGSGSSRRGGRETNFVEGAGAGGQGDGPKGITEPAAAWSLRRAALQEIAHLRNSVLRPGEDKLALFAEDVSVDTIHLACFANDDLAGCATAFATPTPDWWPGLAPRSTWQVKAVATWPWARRKGCGRALMSGIASEVASLGGDALWCNSRISAIPFYLSLGFGEVGDEFFIPGVGPHRRMFKRLGKKGAGTGT